MSRAPSVTEAQLNVIDAFVGRVLDAYKAGAITRQDAIDDIGHVWVAIDVGNESEYTTYPKNWTAPQR